MNKIGFFHTLILTTATVWMVMGTFFYLRQGIVEYHASNTSTVLGTSVHFNPSPERTRQNWRLFENASKGYRFSYPAEWSIEEKDGFINSTHIYPPGHEFELIYSHGEIPNMVGKVEPGDDTILIDIQGKTYKVEEKIIGYKQKSFHLAIEHSINPFDITLRTLTPEMSVYKASRQTVLDIIATTDFIPLEPAVARAGFSEYPDFDLRMYLPSGLRINSRTSDEVIWGDQLFIVHTQIQDFEPIKPKISLVVQKDILVVPIQSVKSEDTTIAGEITTKKYLVACGKTCAYQVVRFSRNEQYYELIFKGAGKPEKRIFDEIIDAIRFE